MATVPLNIRSWLLRRTSLDMTQPCVMCLPQDVTSLRRGSGVGGRKREILSSTMRVNDAKQGTLFIENTLIAL